MVFAGCDCGSLEVPRYENPAQMTFVSTTNNKNIVIRVYLSRNIFHSGNRGATWRTQL